jgi:hypothetical protein
VRSLGRQEQGHKAVTGKWREKSLSPIEYTAAGVRAEEDSGSERDGILHVQEILANDLEVPTRAVSNLLVFIYEHHIR